MKHLKKNSIKQNNFNLLILFLPLISENAMQNTKEFNVEPFNKWSVIQEIRKTIPVDLNKIAEKFNIDLYTAKMDNKISGLIRKFNGKYEIIVNNSHPLTRQRFTIAHELAHFVLHEDKIGDGIIDDVLYRSGLPEKIEIEANQMAADILMPYVKILEKIKQNNNIQDVDGLAEYFQVSKVAMAIRLDRLDKNTHDDYSKEWENNNN